MSDCEVFDYTPDWSDIQDYSAEFRQEQIAINKSLAPYLDSDMETVNRAIFQNSYTLLDDTEINNIYRFWLRKFGQHKSFCLPSFKSDFRTSSATAIGATEIQIYKVNFNSLGRRQHIYVPIIDGSNLYFTVQIEATGTVTLFPSSAMTKAIPAETNLSVIHRVTFVDSLSFDHVTDNKVKFQMNFLEDVRKSDVWTLS